MSNHHVIDFSPGSDDDTPRKLRDVIGRVRNASHDFCESWQTGALNEAEKISQKALEDLDYIVGELLRHRDVKNKSLDCQFKAKLQEKVGLVVTDLSEEHMSWFCELPSGSASLPDGAEHKNLILDTALTKLKHRHPHSLNFTLEPSHTLYALIRAGMGKPPSIIQVPMIHFLNACTAAADSVAPENPGTPGFGEL
jgi:hypothetical protein